MPPTLVPEQTEDTFLERCVIENTGGWTKCKLQGTQLTPNFITQQGRLFSDTELTVQSKLMTTVSVNEKTITCRHNCTGCDTSSDNGVQQHITIRESLHFIFKIGLGSK
jgi:hypothetical protein